MHTIDIYGPLKDANVQNLASTGNDPVEFCGWSPLNKVKNYYLMLTVEQLVLPYDFVKKMNRKCTIYLRLIHHLKRGRPSYHQSSNGIFLDVDDHDLSTK